MRKVLNFTIVAVLAAEALALGQGPDINKVLADVRTALGGEKVAAVKTVSAAGRVLRTSASGATSETEFEMAMELPDKFMRKDVVMAMGNASIYRTSGFNGDGVINEMDTPPQLGGGNMVIRMAGPGGTTIGGPGGKLTPEQLAQANKAMLLANRQDFARLTLGMFATSFAVYPVHFSYAGTAESAEGKAHVLEVKGAGDFSARLFIDSATSLPLMLTWMAKEPLVMNIGGRGGQPGAATGGGGTSFVVSGGGHGGQGGAPTPEQIEAMRKEAEANRRTVEYRVYYAEYKDVDGVKLPHRLQRSIDGKPADETTFDRLQLNKKIDAKKFEISK